jgi:Holliday junction resolvase RusA-like endonuclease
MTSDLLFSTTVYDFVVLPAPHNKQKRTRRVNLYYECRDSLAEHFRHNKETGGFRNAPEIAHPCKMKAVIARKTRRQADFDNLGKTVGDALVKAGIIADDKYIYDGQIIKRVGHSRDYVVVSIYPHEV